MAKGWSLLKFLRKTLFCDSLRVRITLVVLAFSVMVASSFLLAATIMRRHLSREAEGVVTQTMQKIEADFSGPMAAVNIVSDSIRNMMVWGGGEDLPNGYLTDAVSGKLEEASTSLKGQEFGVELGRMYGYFDTFKDEGALVGTFIAPLGGPQKPDFNPAAYPWYTAAVKAGGEVALTQVFNSAQLNVETVACTRRIFDDAGNPLGVVALDVPFQQVRDCITETRLTDGGYGFLMDADLDIIAYPGHGRAPLNLRDFPMEDAGDMAIVEQLAAGGNLLEAEIDDYNGERVVTFSARLSNGWILTLATPTGEYYGDLLRMALIMLLLGAVLAAVLILMLQRLDKAKRKADEANRQKNIRLAEMAKMREADELVQITFDATPLATAIFNQAGEAIDCNHAALAVFEMPDEQSLLSGFWQLLPERQPGGRLSREVLSEHIKKTYQEGRAQFEWTFRLPSGELIPGEATLIRVVYKGERMIAGYYRDMRDFERMLAEIDKRTAERDAQYKKLVAVTQNYKGIVWSVDAGGILTTFRGQYLEKLGLNPADLEGEPILAVQPLLRVDFSEYAKKTRAEGPQDWMLEIDGLTFHAYTAPIYEGDTVSIVGSIDDVTEATKLQHKLEDALAAAEIANKAKSSFLANMSHEIRTPMNAILGITEILVQDDTLPAGVMEGLAKIYASCDLLLGIINDVLDFSKIEAGKLDITPAPYEIASLINDSVQLNMMRVGSKPIEFVLQIDENLPARLVGDELRIKQILNNLLSNAFKYTEEGSVTLRLGFEQRENNEVMLIIGVKDTGQGMTKQQIDKLFDEYTRFQAETARVIEGTGLGMAITQRLVYLMNGEIRVGSEPGRGSLFVVGLPQGIVDAGVLGKEVAENLRTFQLGHIAQRKRMQLTRDYMPYGKVLIVDDVETNIYVAAGLMKLYGLQTETAASGLEAIEKIKDGNTYDIVFMDHMMPVMDGMETTKYLRKLGYTAPIVALTANAVAKQAKLFLQNGFDDFIAKPIDIRQLDTVLNRLVRDKQPPEVIAEALLHINRRSREHQIKTVLDCQRKKLLPQQRKLV